MKDILPQHFDVADENIVLILFDKFGKHISQATHVENKNQHLDWAK